MVLKRVFPLNNPLSENLTHSLSGEKIESVRDPGVKGDEVAKGKGEKGEQVSRFMRMLARCPYCQEMNRVVFYWAQEPKYHRCQGCDQLIPFGALRVMALSNDILNPIF